MREIDQSQILQFHGFLLANTAERLTLFERALTRRIASGDVVLDLGSGTGVLAFLALRAGASKVYAVEETDSIELARSVCAANGVDDRIVLLHCPSFSVELPERADVLVADVFDMFGLQPGGLSCLADARRRLLKETGTLMPSALELYLAPVEAAELYGQRVAFWTRTVSGIDLSALHSCAINNRYPNRFERRALLADGALLARVQLREIEMPSFGGHVTAPIARSGVLHGLCGWFVAHLAEDIRVDNAPGEATTNYAQAFFPIERPVSVKEGDTVKISLQTYDNFGCKWQVEVSAGSQTVAAFEHSTLLGFPLSEERLRMLLPTYTPQLSRRGEAERFLLGLCDGQHSLQALTDVLIERYPDLFRSPDEASGFVRPIIDRTTGAD